MQEIPMEFMEIHGTEIGRNVILQEKEGDELIHSVNIGGNHNEGFGFEWKSFAQMYNVANGQLVVFTLVARSRFLVQIYEVGKRYLANPEDEEAGTICWTGSSWLYE